MSSFESRDRCEGFVCVYSNACTIDFKISHVPFCKSGRGQHQIIVGAHRHIAVEVWGTTAGPSIGTAIVSKFSDVICSFKHDIMSVNLHCCTAPCHSRILLTAPQM